MTSSRHMANQRAAHIMHVVPGLGPGGMQLAMSQVINALEKQGMRHTVVCLRGEPAIRNQICSDVRIHCLRAHPNDLRLAWRLRRLIQEMRPDVIHCRNWSAWPDVAMARLCVARPTPLVFSFHGFDHSEDNPLRRRMAMHVLARFTTRIFTVSGASRQLLAREAGLPANRIDVIPNGVDTDRFRPPDKPLGQRRTVIGTVGGLKRVKNQALLIQAGANLLRDGRDFEIRLAGEGPERNRLQNLVESHGLERHVRLMGHVSNIPDFLRGLDIFVLPSDSEAHPNALLEAMACGLPCVSTRVGGVPEVLQEGGCGRLVTRGDLEGLSAAIADLLAEPDERKRLGRSARERAVNNYTVHRMIRNTRRLYLEVTEEARSKAKWL